MIHQDTCILRCSIHAFEYYAQYDLRIPAQSKETGEAIAPVTLLFIGRDIVVTLGVD